MGDLDLLVLGSGVAGLSAAVRGRALAVGVMSKGELGHAATRWAQGGVAAAFGGPSGSPELHMADTLASGAGLCDTDAVRAMVDEGPRRVDELIALGAHFDRDPDGALQLAREGGHSVARVVHAGGAATGAEIERALEAAGRATAAAIMERWFAVDLLVDDGRCRGVVALDPSGRRHEVRARHTLLASGGAGQLYAVTTNPPEACGDGIAMALRAGAPVADVEFVQFHPTALHTDQMPRPLLSEALRGHGAVLRDAHGDRFVDELARRDVVSRAVARRMAEQGAPHLWLDTTGVDEFAARFPSLAEPLHQLGFDPAHDWLPISPAAHYLCGGVVTDLDGATGLAGLWAAGEVACTGVHGANRLASNSLLEAMVFAARVVDAIGRGKEAAEPTGAMRAVLGPAGRAIGTPAHPSSRLSVENVSDLAHDRPKVDVGKGPGALRAELQTTMTSCAGILRDADSLAQADEVLARMAARDPDDGPAGFEVRNLATVGRAVVHAALAREETRGAHARTDFPETAPDLAVRLVVG